MSAPDSRAARKAATKASPAPVVSIASIFGALTRQRCSPCSGLGAGRAALDDDQRIVRRKPRALGFGIVGARENRRFLFVGEQDCRASRPCEEFVGADLAQELRRGRIDADGLVSRAPHDVENRRARRRERRTNSRRDGCAPRRRSARRGCRAASSASLAPRSVRKLRSPSGSMSAISRPVSAVRIADEMRRDADRLEARCLAFDVSGADAGDEIDARRRTRRATPPDWLPSRRAEP